MAENAIISDLEFAPQLTDDMVLAVEDTKNTYSATLGALREQLNKLFIEKKDVDFDTLTDDGFYQVSGTLNHQPTTGQITWLVQVVKDGTVIVQNAFGTDSTNFSKIFVRRYNGTSWSSWTNISASGVDLSTKANTDLSNVSSNIDYVVEYWRDGVSWFRKFKSGWLEQGGVIQIEGSTYKDITLFRPYISITYITTFSHTVEGTTSQKECYAQPQSTTVVRLGNACGNSQYFHWTIKGQGA